MDKYKIAYKNEYLIFYILPYIQFEEYGKDFARLDAYYVASNEVYHYARRQNIGKIDNEKNYKDILSRFSDDFVIGKNTLLLHKEYGSRFAIACIKVSGDIDESQFLSFEKKIKTCTNCDLCISICPTGALSEERFNKDRCIRQIMNTDFSQSDGKLVQNFLFGCDLCQQVCPQNAKERTPLPAELKEKLSYKYLQNCLCDPQKMRFLEKYVGKNYVKFNRLCRLIRNGINNASPN